MRIRIMACRSHRMLMLVAILALGVATFGASPAAAEVSRHRTEAGHVFHYMTVEKGKEVAIVVSWPSDWIEGDGALATPYVGATLMMNSGAGRRDAATLAADFQDLNAKAAIDANADAVVGSLLVRPEHLRIAVSLGRNVLLNNHFNERWLGRVQQNLIAGQNRVHRTLSGATLDVVRRAVLGDGRLNDTLTLRPPTLINEVGVKDIKAWHGETFTASGMTIAAAGPAAPERVGEAIDRLLDGLPAGERRGDAGAGEALVLSAATGLTIHLEQPETAKTLFGFAGRMAPARGKDRLYDLFAEAVLGAGQRSRLFDAVRTELRASYVVDADIGSYDRDHRLFFLFGEVDRQLAGEAYGAFRNVYEAFRRDGMTAEEFSRVQAALAADFRESAKRPERMAWSLMWRLLDEDPLSYRLAERSEMVEAMTLDEVNAAIRERLPAFDDMIKVVTGPDGGGIEADCVIASIAEVDDC